MSITYFPTQNRNGIRDLSKSVTLGSYYYNTHRGPAEPAAKAAMNPANLGLSGMGAVVPLNLQSSSMVVGVDPIGPSNSVVTPVGPVGDPLYTPVIPVSSQSSPTPRVAMPVNNISNRRTGILQVTSGGGTASPSYGGTSSTAAQVAGTPVPAGYSINAPFINSDGSQWEFSASQNTWINVGSPYNLNAASAPLPTSSTALATTSAASLTSGLASTAAQVAGTPVPVGYPITSVYTDTSGNTWAYSSVTGTWTVSSLSTSTTAASTTTSADFSDQVAAWLGGSTSIAGFAFPNALLAAATALGVALLWGRGKR